MEGLNAAERELFRGIELVLRTGWPPVTRFSPAVYELTVKEIFYLALGTTSSDRLQLYLRDIAIEHADWNSEPAAHRSVAMTIVNLSTELL